MCAVPQGPQLLAQHMAHSRCLGKFGILGCMHDAMDVDWAAVSVSTEDGFAACMSGQDWKS